MQSHGKRLMLGRREFLGLMGTGAGALVIVNRGHPVVARPEVASPMAGTAVTGRIVEQVLEAVPVDVELGGRVVSTWAYNGQVPGPEIRLTEGETLRVTIRNQLPEGTSIHWHGLPIPNAMDGVPGLTQSAIAPGADFVYEFVAPVAGTYLYHSHVGPQLDRGLYGPMVINPVRESLSYDREFIVMLDDWIDGLEGTPDDVLARLRAGEGEMADMNDMAGMDDVSGTAVASDRPVQWPPDLVYPLYLINGRPPETPVEFTVRRGDRVRFRISNPGGATIFRVALAGHRLTVTHTDGLPVEPVTVDVLRVGMGERYDVLVEADNPGVWQLAAQAEGTAMLARALVRYEGSSMTPPAVDAAPAELSGRLLLYDMLQAGPEVVTPTGAPEAVVSLTLGGTENPYIWTINDQTFPQADVITIERNQLVRFELHNRSGMPHPMHLHGVSFRVDTGEGRGPLKDTVLVEPKQRLAIDWIASNPGDWAFHCHHSYHLEVGMMRVVRVA